MAIELTKDNFKQEILDSGLPAIVDFWATWCMPCRMVATVVEEIATEYAGKVKVGKVNVDDEGGLAAQYGVMSIPTLAFFKDGKVIETIVGNVPKAHIAERIEKSFGKL